MTFKEQLNEAFLEYVRIVVTSGKGNPLVRRAKRNELVDQIIELVKKEVIGEDQSIGKFVSVMENPEYGLQQVQKEACNTLRQEQRERVEI